MLINYYSRVSTPKQAKPQPAEPNLSDTMMKMLRKISMKLEEVHQNRDEKTKINQEIVEPVPFLPSKKPSGIRRISLKPIFCKYSRGIGSSVGQVVAFRFAVPRIVGSIPATGKSVFLNIFLISIS